MTAYTYTMPDYLETPTDRYEVITNAAHFLMAQGLSIHGTWRGRMRAADQRKLFGVFLGKGTIVIDGEAETVAHRYKTCFGLDSETSVWLDCRRGTIATNFWSHDGATRQEREIEAARLWFRY